MIRFDERPKDEPALPAAAVRTCDYVCVGGPADGSSVTLSTFTSEISMPPPGVVGPISRYIKTSLDGERTRFFFLRYEGLAADEAIRKLLKSYITPT